MSVPPPSLSFPRSLSSNVFIGERESRGQSGTRFAALDLRFRGGDDRRKDDLVHAYFRDTILIQRLDLLDHFIHGHHIGVLRPHVK